MSNSSATASSDAVFASIGAGLEKIIADINASRVAASQPDERSFVLLFNQITPKTIEYLNERGLVTKEGVPSGDVRFMFAGAPFNCKLAETRPQVKTFIECIKATGGVFNMPPFGDAYAASVQPGSPAVNSVIPFRLGIDGMLLKKIEAASGYVTAWLRSATIAEKFKEATQVADRLEKFVEESLPYIRDRPNLTIEEHREKILVPRFGDDWRAKSQNLNTEYFLTLFGATEELMVAFRVARHDKPDEKGVKLIETARWVANYMNLFKPTTEYGGGAIGDVLNFAAMMSSVCSGLTFEGKLTDAHSVQVFENFSKIPIDKFPKIAFAIFDMEPDDVGVITFLLRHFPDTSIVRMYATESLANRVEALMADKFAENKLAYKHPGLVMIDPELMNGNTVEGIYFKK